MKKTSKKTSIKKYETGGVKPYAGGVKLYDGKVTLAGSNKVVGTAGTATPKPKATTKSTTKTTTKPEPPKFANKQVTKKDGKTIVTYDTRTRTGMTDFFGTSPYPATVRKVYDSKGNLISGTKTTKGSYGSSTTERIKDPVKKKTTAKSTKPATTKPTTKPTTATKTKPKQVTKPTVTKPTAKTVSQMWTEKTGTSWADAKKQGLTDGTAAGNMALMKKLQSGSPMEYTRAYTGPDYAATAAAEELYGPPATTMRKGGRVKSKMKSKKK